ncbi:MAG: Clp protease ClpP [Balneolaceae bacterium]|nr:Clp protease ClpP [Balneolaceae bacterium]
MNVPKLKVNIRPRAAASDTATIDIDGEIGGASYDGEEHSWNTPEAIKRKLIEIQNIQADKIIVNINSLGGFIHDGLAIHDVLAMHPAKIETRVIGMTASAATIIAQAGDVRKMSENALYLIHRAWGAVLGNKTAVLEFIKELKVVDNRMADIYRKRSNASRSKILSIMDEAGGQGRWLDADQANDIGLIDESFEPMKMAASFNRATLLGYGLPLPDIKTPDLSYWEAKIKQNQNMN